MHTAFDSAWRTTSRLAAAVALGLWLWLGYGIGRGPGNGWLHAKLLVVLDHLAQSFEPGRTYPEKDVNEILGDFHPDYAALRVATAVLSGRMFNEIREKRGFAYDAHTELDLNREAGVFKAVTQVRNEVLAEAMAACAVWLRVRRSVPTGSSRLQPARRVTAIASARPSRVSGFMRRNRSRMRKWRCPRLRA